MWSGIGAGERVSLTGARDEVFEAPILPFGPNEALLQKPIAAVGVGLLAHGLRPLLFLLAKMRNTIIKVALTRLIGHQPLGPVANIEMPTCRAVSTSGDI